MGISVRMSPPGHYAKKMSEGDYDEGAMLAIPFEVFAKMNPNHPVVLQVLAARAEANKRIKAKKRAATVARRATRREQEAEHSNL